MARLDPHSYADDQQAQTEHLHWTAQIDFATQVIRAEATLTFRAPASGRVDLDTRELEIESVVDDRGEAVPFTLAPAEPILGSCLSLQLAPGTRSVRLRYRTAPTASALQWLTPPQTLGGRQPFLFSQCQAIHARSIIPLQDTPRLRLRYTAELSIPTSMTAVMAAAHRGRSERDGRAVERWEMPQPIPPYLLAFAVGELASKDLSPRARVWAEPGLLDAAAWELAEVEEMIVVAESLFGPYDWERFDVLVMPPSFPYGGMENPRLTFLTPTVIAGDRSLVSVVAHELAHSWTGNLVTNANAEHFWLNEGFTMYAERRIVEAREGREMAVLHAALGWRELAQSMKRFPDRPELTHLRTKLWGIDPDDAYSLVPYEKGYFFLCALEEAVGRPAFSAWLRTYLDAFRFGAITTDDFLVHIERGLPGALAAARAEAWLDAPWLPADAVAPRSERVEAIERAARGVPEAAHTKEWSATEWQLFIESVPRPASLATCRALDERFSLTTSTNYDVLVSWLSLALETGDLSVLPRVKEVLGKVGRMKYLRPLYTALSRAPTTRALAGELYQAHGASYHPIARQLVESLLAAP